MFVWAEKLSYMEQSQNKSIKAVAEKLQRKTANYWYYHWYPFIWDFCSAKAIVQPCYITQIKRIYKERKKKVSAQTQTKGWEETETSDIFWGFTETNQLREEYEPAQFHPSIRHPHMVVLSTCKFQVWKSPDRDPLKRLLHNQKVSSLSKGISVLSSFLWKYI